MLCIFWLKNKSEVWRKLKCRCLILAAGLQVYWADKLLYLYFLSFINWKQNRCRWSFLWYQWTSQEASCWLVSMKQHNTLGMGEMTVVIALRIDSKTVIISCWGEYLYRLNVKTVPFLLCKFSFGPFVHCDRQVLSLCEAPEFKGWREYWIFG